MRSRPSSSISIASTPCFLFCAWALVPLVLFVLRLLDPAVDPRSGALILGIPAPSAADGVESSIIIIACRRLDPALMITGASANGMDDWECETGNGSEINVGGKWVVWAVGWNDSFVGVGRPLLALWRGAALSGGGEGDVGADGGVMLGTGGLGVGSDEGCDN